MTGALGFVFILMGFLVGFGAIPLQPDKFQLAIFLSICVGIGNILLTLAKILAKLDEK